MNYYPANEVRLQPVNPPRVTTWFESLQKWITGGRVAQQCLNEAPFADGIQAHDNFRVRRLFEETQRPLTLIPHCIAISAIAGPNMDRR